MKYKLLGRSGLRVSELCLGCSTFGVNWGPIGSDLAESRRVFDTFASAGGNFLDTSNKYQEGQSEEFVGEFIQGNRDYWVVGTKFSLVDGMKDGADPNACGNHRKNLVRSVEGSLKRLKTDYIDLLWLHMWDYTTPIEEIICSLTDLVRSGKVRYIGASNFPAWWIVKANAFSQHHALSPFVATQVEYALTERSLEPEFLPMCHEEDVALCAWSPLGGGMCTGKYNRPGGNNPAYRLAEHVDPARKAFWHAATARNLAIMDRVNPIADAIGRPTVQVALRWMIQQVVTTIPIFAAHNAAQCKEIVGASDFHLTAEQWDQVEAATRPAVASVWPEVGPYPYPMLEYGSPALPGFYSRGLLYGRSEYVIENHRRPFRMLHRPNG
ncbi:aldo/keto reductase [Opitutaceae bacterium EW11]|nr:aldo/keto reductase [Opitutaceae bacterium EW11]